MSADARQSTILKIPTISTTRVDPVFTMPILTIRTDPVLYPSQMVKPITVEETKTGAVRVGTTLPKVEIIKAGIPTTLTKPVIPAQIIPTEKTKEETKQTTEIQTKYLQTPEAMITGGQLQLKDMKVGRATIMYIPLTPLEKAIGVEKGEAVQQGIEIVGSVVGIAKSVIK